MISAKDAIAHLTAEDQDAMKAGEDRCDAALRRYEGTPVRVDFEHTNTRRKVLERLVDMYNANGWTAKIQHGDQRDAGPWIEFDVRRDLPPFGER